MKPLERIFPIAALVAGFIFLGAAVALGETRDIEGVYRVTGANPDGAGDYQGEVAVARTGDVYQIAWLFGGDQHVGTGVLLDNQLSVVYQPEGQTAGIAVYQIKPNGALDGVWTTLGGRALGTEEWTPQGRL